MGQQSAENLQLLRRVLALLFALFCNIQNVSSSSLLPDPTTGIGYHKHHHYKQLLSPDLSAATRHPTPSLHDLNRSVAFGNDVIERLHRLEDTLLWSDVDLKVGTPAHEYMVNAMPEEAALGQAKQAHVAARATLHLMGLACHRRTTRVDCSHHLQATYHLHNTSLSAHCPAHSPSISHCSPKQPYRAHSGACNNIHEPTLGASNTQYKRLLFPNYLDGVQEVRRSVVKKRVLPSARRVSTGLMESGGIQGQEEMGLTLMGMVWAQMVGMDVSHTVVNRMIHTEKSIDCCTETGDSLTPRYIHPFCQAIEIPDDDPYYSKLRIKCMNYVRSMLAVNSDCTFGPYEQLNQATHFLDASHIYGNDEKKAQSLRAWQHGQLRSTSVNGKIMLPIVKRKHECSGKTCFASGDSRVNFNPQSTAIYTIFLREHNRLAKQLGELNPTWDDEELYQTARKMVIAQVQHITYDHWLPLIIGQKFVYKMGISKYLETADPSVSNSFATAAFRFLKSLMKSNISLLEEDRSTNATINILKYFNDPSILERPDYLDSLIRSMATEKSEKADFYYSKDLTNYLYGNGKIGLDIVSLDIQRGRDHGLPSYTAYRAKCGLPMVNTFQELADFMSRETIDSLSKIYASPNDIDLLVGGMLEKSYSESLLGPTFSCILADQFKRTRQGDRYFYTNLLQPDPFTDKQIESIKRTTLAKIICHNSDGIEKMQRDVFQAISNERNPLESCLFLEDLDITLWKE